MQFKSMMCGISLLGLAAGSGAAFGDAMSPADEAVILTPAVAVVSEPPRLVVIDVYEVMPMIIEQGAPNSAGPDGVRHAPDVGA
jgi:hypothetical protein